MEEDITIKKWVGGICIHNNSVFLIHRINKDNNFNKEYFVFPGKDVEGDENIEEALQEAFLDFSLTIKLKELIYLKEDDINGQEFYYLCNYVFGNPSVREGSNEAEEMKGGEQVFIPIWVPISELDTLVVYPESIKETLLEMIQQ